MYGGGKKANQDQGQDTCSHPKEATIFFFLNFMLSLPTDLLLQEVLSRSKTKIEMFISLLLRQTHLMD